MTQICARTLAILAGLMLTGSAALAQPVSPEEAYKRLQERKAAAEKAAAEAAEKDRPRSVESSERLNLLARLSGSYWIPDPNPDPPAPLTLEQLARSKDSAMAAVARQRINTLKHYDRYFDAGSPTLQTVAASYSGMYSMVRFLYLGEEDASNFVADMTGPGGLVTDSLNRAVAVTRAAQAALESEVKLRAAVAAMLDARPREADYSRAGIETGFEVKSDETNGPPEEINAALYNRTGKSLYNCVVIVRVRPDARALTALRHQNAQNTWASGVVLSLFGVQPHSVKAAAELNDARIAAAQAEQGDIYYIPEWKQGRKMELLLGPATAAGLWQSVDVTVWADQGKMKTRDLGADRIVAEVEKNFDTWRKAMDRKRRYEYAKQQAEEKKKREEAMAKAFGTGKTVSRGSSRRTFGGNWVAAGRGSRSPLGR